MSPTITIVVDPQGRTRIETSGFVGTACRDATRTLVRALGATTAEQLTAEFFRPAQAVDDRLTQSS